MSTPPTAPRATRTRSTPPTSSPIPRSPIDGKEVDATKITPEFLQDTLQEAGGIEANVATGYHAIEFLLWGQDLNGTGPGAGERPATDYDISATAPTAIATAAAQYLKAATDLLVSDLEEMVGDWQRRRRGAQAELQAPASPAILTGMGSLSYGELAGERMKLGLLLHDPEEEHDCFSDNTHISHLNDAIGIQNVYLGKLHARRRHGGRGPVARRAGRGQGSRRSTPRSRRCSTTPSPRWKR